jgi:hypothetical protein
LLNLTGATLGPGATASNPAHWGFVPISVQRMASAASTPLSAGIATAILLSMGDISSSATARTWQPSTRSSHESQNLQASAALGASTQPKNHLDQIRLNLTYFYQSTYGINFGWQNTWGNPNPELFAPNPISGSANGKPNSNVSSSKRTRCPFGKADSWARPLAT